MDDIKRVYKARLPGTYRKQQNCDILEEELDICPDYIVRLILQRDIMRKVVGILLMASTIFQVNYNDDMYTACACIHYNGRNQFYV